MRSEEEIKQKLAQEQELIARLEAAGFRKKAARRKLVVRTLLWVLGEEVEG